MNEFLRAVARGVRCTRVTAQDVVQCVSRRLLWCPCGVGFCDRSAALGAARETQRLPALRGSSQRAAAPATLFRPPGRPCRKESQTFGLIPFRILWIPSAVGCQSTHARLRSSSRGGQPALASTSAPGARDHKKGNRPPCLQKFLDLDPSRATGPRVWNRSFCPRPQRATGPRVYKSSSKTGPPGDNQSHRNPDLPV